MTTQVSDQLIYDGKQHSIFSEPLNLCHDECVRRLNYMWNNTACYRGYIADWEVADDRLFLTGVEATVCTKPYEESAPKSRYCSISHSGDCLPETKNLHDIFPNSDGKVSAEWYSGEIRLPLGEMIKYIHCGYETEYENYLLLEFNSGSIVGSRVITHAEWVRQKDERMKVVSVAIKSVEIENEKKRKSERDEYYNRRLERLGLVWRPRDKNK
jgi:hypothetical protein